MRYTYFNHKERAQKCDLKNYILQYCFGIVFSINIEVLCTFLRLENKLNTVKSCLLISEVCATCNFS